MGNRMQGVVKWFNEKKGYGFITTKEGRDLFVHYSDIEADGFRALTEGDPVSFKAKINMANKELEDAENAWCDAMKAAKQGKINHKGDIIEYIRGRTTKDHARFRKS